MQRILNPDGDYSVQIISYDITDRKRTEEFLRASEEKFSTVFHFSPDAIAIVRASDGIFVDVNEAFTKLLGFPFSEVVGKNWNELRPTASVDAQNKISELFKRTGMVADYELSFQNSKHSKATMLLSLIPITVSQEPSVLAIAHDITQHKRSEEALRAVQAELAVGVQQRIALEERQRLARELHELGLSSHLWHFIRRAHGPDAFRHRSPKSTRSFKLCAVVGAGRPDRNARINF